MVKVILSGDETNTVHDFSFGCILCNHVPLDESEYTVVDDLDVNCPKCKEWDIILDKNAQEIADMVDKEILDDMNRVLSDE